MASVFNRVPPLHLLIAFEAAARLGSFARAAEELSVTPSAVSHRIKNLEELWGEDLFVRANAALRLTAAGTRYLRNVQDALKALNEHVVHCNQFIEKNPPFELRKDESQAPRVSAILVHLCESCTHLAVLLSPVLPEAATKILSQLRAGDLAPRTCDELKWGLLPVGHRIGKAKPVFPRIVREQDE